MKTVHSTTIILILIACVTGAQSWDNEELEIFDLVEEIKTNFYELMGIKQDSTLQEIKRAFRNLSIIIHPDKSDAEDADVQFRNLVSVYEVLKDNSKRTKYDKVLKEGLPNWKSFKYYYRHVRKMGLLEMSIILLVILTVSQYLIAWAAYIERKYTAEQLFGSRLKKMQKKNRANFNLEEILNEIPTPSVMNTLPFQIPRAIWHTPGSIKSVFMAYRQHRREEEERLQREREEEEELKLLEEELAKEKEAKGLRKRKPLFVAPEKTDEELSRYSRTTQRIETIENVKNVRPVAGGLWTDEDLAELTRLIKKYPGGTTDRWELIADALYRNVSEVTHMAHKLKENNYRMVNPQESSVAEAIATKAKVKTKSEQILVPETNWSQEQQQELESAIVKYPKSNATDRWQKISACVPGKTKEECLLRYKYLVEAVKKQRQAAKNTTTTESVASPAENETPKETNKPAVKAPPQKQAEQDEEEEVAPAPIETKGKKRNLRKERKKKMEFSSDEDDVEDEQ